jgi:hypothetical protein
VDPAETSSLRPVWVTGSRYTPSLPESGRRRSVLRRLSSSSVPPANTAPPEVIIVLGLARSAAGACGRTSPRGEDGAVVPSTQQCTTRKSLR